MADPQIPLPSPEEGSGNFFAHMFSWIKERVTATFTWLTKDRVSIREELTERMADMKTDHDITGALGRGFLDNSLSAIRDRFQNGGMTSETQDRVARSVADRVSRLSQQDKDLISDV